LTQSAAEGSVHLPAVDRATTGFFVDPGNRRSVNIFFSRVQSKLLTLSLMGSAPAAAKFAAERFLLTAHHQQQMQFQHALLRPAHSVDKKASSSKSGMVDSVCTQPNTSLMSCFFPCCMYYGPYTLRFCNISVRSAISCGIIRVSVSTTA